MWSRPLLKAGITHSGSIIALLAGDDSVTKSNSACVSRHCDIALNNVTLSEEHFHTKTGNWHPRFVSATATSVQVDAFKISPSDSS